MADATRATTDLRALPEADLRAQLDQLRGELWHKRIKLREGALQQTHDLRRLRRQIARVQTALRAPRQAGA